MSDTYFSDREQGPRPRTEEEVGAEAWGGIVVAINSRIAASSFGHKYPLLCEDGLGVYGCDEGAFALALRAEVPGIDWPLYGSRVPPTLVVLDLIEFCHRAVGMPMERDYHSFFSHTHLRFDVTAGQAAFREDINRILARNGLAYELTPRGTIRRLAPPVLGEVLKRSLFSTGDAELDLMLEAARTKFLDPDLSVRKEALEKLWDAWERLKTIELPTDKKQSVAMLLAKVPGEPAFRDLIDKEAAKLTEVGNTFQIRHSEIGKVPVTDSVQIDHLFQRLFAVIWLLLKSTGRGG